MRSTHCPSIIDPIYTVLLCLLFVLLIPMAYGHAQHLMSSLCYLIIAISISHLPRNIMFTLNNNTLAVSTATIKDPIYFYKSYIQVTTRDCISKR